MRVLIIDNYDSFTFNLFHYVEALNVDVTVVRNDQVHFNELLSYDKIIISPGPGLPRETTNLMEVLHQVIGKIPVLGVCLGMQAIGIHFGGALENQARVRHGVTEKISCDVNSKLFNGLPGEFQVGLYHSWMVKKDSLPANLKITATSTAGVVMALEDPLLEVYGVQFHPESILSEYGKELIENFILKI